MNRSLLFDDQVHLLGLAAVDPSVGRGDAPESLRGSGIVPDGVLWRESLSRRRHNLAWC